MAKARMWMLAALMACRVWAGTPQAATAPPPPHAAAPSKRDEAKPKLTDAQLQAAIRAKFAQSKINEDKFTVRVQGGVAIIEGKTDVGQHKGVATRMSFTAGASAVENRIEVRSAAGTAKTKATSGAETANAVEPPARPQPAAVRTVKRAPVRPKLSDAQLESAIRAKFAASKINEDKFTVRVQGGVATIDGKTEVIQHKGVATRMSKTAGAVAVNNRVQVSEAAKDKAAGNLEQGRRRVQVKRGDTRSERK